VSKVNILSWISAALFSKESSHGKSLPLVNSKKRHRKTGNKELFGFISAPEGVESKVTKNIIHDFTEKGHRMKDLSWFAPASC
jgi:hypothetical protein